MLPRDGRILLGMKKRGTGTGLWQHAFAGKVKDIHFILWFGLLNWMQFILKCKRKFKFLFREI